MDVRYLEITPEMAGKWLLKSNGNHRWKTGKFVDKCKVKKISEDIKNGMWNPGNNSIAFDESGVLVDGHHRLSAIKESGNSVWSIVVFGVTHSGLQHIDENDTRKIHQRLGVDSQITSIANYHFWLSGEPMRAKSSAVVSEWIMKHPAVYTVKDICTRGSQHPVAKKSYVMHGALCALEFGVDDETILRFFNIVNSGFSESAFDSPAIVLRNMLIKAYRADRGAGVALDYATQAAISDYVEGSQRRRAYTEKTGFYFDKLVISGKEGYEKCSTKF